MSEKNSNWFSFSRGEGLFLIGILLYVVIFFLPWSYERTILGVTLMAWGALLLFLLAPLAGLMLALKGERNGQHLQHQAREGEGHEIN